MKNAFIKLLKQTAYNVYLASLCSGPSRLHVLFEELINPKVGDLAMETTTHRRLKRPGDGIGRIVRIDKATSEIETVFHLECIFSHGRILKWENAHFIKVKEDTLK